MGEEGVPEGASASRDRGAEWAYLPQGNETRWYPTGETYLVKSMASWVVRASALGRFRISFAALRGLGVSRSRPG